MDTLMPLLFLAILGAILFYAFGTAKFDVRVRCMGGTVTIDGKLAQGKTAKLQHFFSQFARDRTFTVLYSYPRGGKRSPARFRGPLTEGEKQQIRNFLLNEL